MKLRQGFANFIRSKLVEMLQNMLGNKDASKILEKKPVLNMEALITGNSSQNSSNGISQSMPASGLILQDESKDYGETNISETLLLGSIIMGCCFFQFSSS
jgi:hypothetical protein